MADSSLGSKETAAPSQGGVAVLEQALWRDLTGTADEAVFASAWVGLVHRMIPGIGHWTQQEKPDDVNRLLFDWLSRRFPDLSA